MSIFCLVLKFVITCAFKYYLDNFNFKFMYFKACEVKMTIKIYCLVIYLIVFIQSVKKTIIIKKKLIVIQIFVKYNHTNIPLSVLPI